MCAPMSFLNIIGSSASPLSKILRTGRIHLSSSSDSRPRGILPSSIPLLSLQHILLNHVTTPMFRKNIPDGWKRIVECKKCGRNFEPTSPSSTCPNCGHGARASVL